MTEKGEINSIFITGNSQVGLGLLHMIKFYCKIFIHFFKKMILILLFLFVLYIVWSTWNLFKESKGTKKSAVGQPTATQPTQPQQQPSVSESKSDSNTAWKASKTERELDLKLRMAAMRGNLLILF